MIRKTLTGMIALLLCSFIVRMSMAQDAPVVTLTPSEDAVLTPGAEGEWDAVSVRFPHILFVDDIYYLFYGT
ncbi:MAG: hypothetical protein ABI835_18700, partial [Chloroflexota bacterium]